MKAALRFLRAGWLGWALFAVVVAYWTSLLLIAWFSGAIAEAVR